MNKTRYIPILYAATVGLLSVFWPLWAAADTLSLTASNNMTPSQSGTKKSVTDSLTIVSSDTSFQRNGTDNASFAYRYRSQASAEGAGSWAANTGYLRFNFSLTPAVWRIMADIEYRGVVAVSTSAGEAGVSNLVLSSSGSASGLSHTLTGAGRNTPGGTTFDRTTGPHPPVIATAETGSGSVRLTLEYGAYCTGAAEAYASLGQMSPLSAFGLDDTWFDSDDSVLLTLTFTPSLNFTGQTADWDLVMASGETLTGYGTINGDVIMHSGGTLNVKIGGPDLGQYDHFDFYGNVNLAGTLRVEPLPGFVPQNGQVFRIMNCHAGTTGTFEVLDLQSLGPGFFWDTSKLYTDGEIMVTICPSPVIGDLNNDCKVDFTDFAEFGSHWLEDTTSYWEKTFGGSGTDTGQSIQQTSDGGYIIAGGTTSFSAGGDSDVYLIKTDSAGNLVWQKILGGSGSDSGNSVQQTSDGGYVIAGSTQSFGAGMSDVYLIKTDSGGNSLWQKTFGSIYNDFGHSVQQTSDGGYVIAGQIFYSYGSAYVSDVYLVKTDSAGNLLWTKIFGGYTTNESGNAVQQTTDGGFIIVGSAMRDRGSGHLDADIYIIKTDSAGNLLWEHYYNAHTENDDGFSVRQTFPDEGYIIAGRSTSWGLWTDVWLIKIDSAGNFLWSKEFGKNDRAEIGYSVQQTSDGGFAIAGETGFGYSENSGDVYLIKTDSAGNLLWQKTFGGSDYYDKGYSVQQTTDGGYVIAGWTESFGAGLRDVYLIKLDFVSCQRWDFICDCKVDIEDLAIFVSHWLECSLCP